jgi:hypothetical protein
MATPNTLTGVLGRRFAGMVAVIVGLALSGCGDSEPNTTTPSITNGERLTHEALVAKLNRLCERYGARVGHLPLAAKRAALNDDYETSADLYDQRVSIGLESMSDLRNLGIPPARDAAAFTFLLNASQQQEDAVAKVAEALRSRDIDAVEAELKIAARALADQRAASKTLGADRCA